MRISGCANVQVVYLQVSYFMAVLHSQNELFIPGGTLLVMLINTDDKQRCNGMMNTHHIILESST